MMSMIRWLLPFVLFFKLANSNDSLYTIVAPNSFRPNAYYQLVITIHQSSSPVNVSVRLFSTRFLSGNEKNEDLAYQETRIESGQSKLIQLDIGSVQPGDYKLKITGSGGISFTETSPVTFNKKFLSAFIQTDKAVYKPGQAVHFRVIVTDAELKPLNTNDTNIFILDNQGNRIKQWNDVSFEKGIFSGDLQLSDQVNIGEWQIKAKIKNSDFVKKFSIDEYVLPTFEVEVKPPSFATFEEPRVLISVGAKYTYGKPVQGQVLLTVFKKSYNCWQSYRPCDFDSSTSESFTTNTTISGKADIMVDLIRDLQLPGWLTTSQTTVTFQIIASVTEDLTGKQLNDTGYITLYKTKYKLKFSDSGKFKPGLKYTTTLQVSLQDDSPILNENEHIIVEYSKCNLNLKNLNYSIPQNGQIQIEIVPPKRSDCINFNANFRGARASSLVWKADSRNGNYLQLSLLSPDPKVGDRVKLAVESNKKLEKPLILQVVGRGQILHSEKIEPSKTKAQEIFVTLTSEMAPKIRVIVYYATRGKEVVADAIDFAVDGLFKTKVILEATPNSTSPGYPVEVAISTLPSAYVGLLAVDQSVLLLKTGNDITSKQILDDLQAYDVGRRVEDSDFGDRYWFHPTRYFPSSNVQLFKEFGLVFFTNEPSAPKVTPWIYPRFRPSYDDGVRMRGLPGPFVSSFMPKSAELPGAQTPYHSRTNQNNQNNFVQPKKIRRHFPETFLWTNATADDDGKVLIEALAPDTITSFVITAFAMDTENGLGLTNAPTKLKVFRDFFVTLNLPYSIVRGEVVALQALVFNYLDEDIDTQVTLYNEGGNLEFVEFENSIDEEMINQKNMTKKIKVKAGEGTSVSFLVLAKKVGHVDIKVIARSVVAADAIERKLLVKAEGSTLYSTKAYFIDLRNETKFEDRVFVDIPEDAVKESENIQISAIGDVMGTTISNLDKLLRMPYGCGEQNMINFVPNIFITQYLTETKQMNDEIKSRAINFMETGYQRELTYKRKDNSFSAFGNRDKEGSTWLTAFVVKSFIQARPYITIDDDVIAKSLSWLASLRTVDGFFPEVGQVLDKNMQGGSGTGIGLTAYVLSTFLEAKANKVDLGYDTVDSIVNSTVLMLEKEIFNLDSDYELILTTYVLHLANSHVKDDAFRLMEQTSKIEKSVKYWSIPLTNEKVNSRNYYHRPRPVDVEMTSYALLTYILRKEIAEAVPIMRWLLSKRNENGGFESTQDTVMGIQSLAKFASMLSSDDEFRLDITLTYAEGRKNFELNKQNALIFQQEKLPKTARNLALSATGNGVGMVQISWSYNVININDQPSFTIITHANDVNEQLELQICAQYVYEINGESNMAVMEIDLPSGYVVDKETLPTVDREKMIKRVDTKDGDSAVVIYFDKIGNEICTNVNANRAFKVAKVKPALVEVYDYYDPLKRGKYFYQAPDVSVCELCETEECKRKENC